jgi:ribosome maturation factor RimP
MAALIERYVGREVIIYSNTGEVEHSDRGHLEAADEHYLVLRNNNGEELVFPCSQVREVKINGARH